MTTRTIDCEVSKKLQRTAADADLLRTTTTTNKQTNKQTNKTHYFIETAVSLSLNTSDTRQKNDVIRIDWLTDDAERRRCRHYAAAWRWNVQQLQIRNGTRAIFLKNEWWSTTK